MAFTSLPQHISAPAFLAALKSESTTSAADCETGKALSPRSTMDSIPFAWKYSVIFSGVRLKNEGLRKLAFGCMCPLNSLHGLTLVKLHLPLPVIIILRPGRGIFSSTMTFPFPFCVSSPAACDACLDEIVCAAPDAAIIPAAPAPMTIMSAENFSMVKCKFYIMYAKLWKNIYICSPFCKKEITLPV